MNIEYSKTAVKFINSTDKPTKQRIKVGIEKLTEEPPKGDIKMMKGYSDLVYRLRIGKYRIIYEYTTRDGEPVLHIKDIDSRGDIYK